MLWEVDMENSKNFEKIGLRIKLYRERQGISLKDLCKKSGIPQYKLEKIENGEIVYRFNTLEKVASVLGVKLTDLLNFEV